MPSTVTVLGANGQLGSDVCLAFAERGWIVRPLIHTDLDIAIATERQMSEILGDGAPSVVVNTAAFTDVPRCEIEPERAFAVNAEAVRRLGRACGTLGARFMHLSTDYVFDGAKRVPYVESDAPHPIQVYGTTKLAGEGFASAEAPRWSVVRTSGLYGAKPCRGKGGANFVSTMLRLARERGEVTVVDDEWVTPTYTKDLAEQLERIAAADATGLFHATPQGQVTWHDFAAAIFEITGTRVALKRTTAAQFPGKVRRPAYSVLENAALKTLGLDAMPDWRSSLERFLRETDSTG